MTGLKPHGHIPNPALQVSHWLKCVDIYDFSIINYFTFCFISASCLPYLNVCNVFHDDRDEGKKPKCVGLAIKCCWSFALFRLKITISCPVNSGSEHNEHDGN